MNKKISSTFGILVVLIIAGFFGYVFLIGNENNNMTKKEVKIIKDDNNREIQESNIEEADMDNWNTYKNEEYGFEFKYPNEWGEFKKIYKSDANKHVSFGVTYKTSSNQTHLGMNNDALFISKGGVSENINYFKETEKYKKIFNDSESSGEPEEIKILNGVAFYYIDKTYKGGPLPTTVLIGPEEKWTITINNTYIDEELEKDNAINLKKIISTFEFIN